MSGSISESKLNINIRWLIRRDMDAVLEIERGSFENVWSEEEFNTLLRQRNVIGMVADLSDGSIGEADVVGFMIYELHKSCLDVLNFAVNPRLRRQGIGAQMVQRLVGKLSEQRRKELVLTVRESNLGGQLFFYSQGFRAVDVLRRYYDDNGEDAYAMRYRLKQFANSV